MDLSDDVCQNLITWLNTLITPKTKSNAEICDGVAICQALVQISPEIFGKLQPKIKTDVGNNWRLKVSNLKKINEAIMLYLQDTLNLHILDLSKPDLVKLGETNDLKQLGKLLRLVLVCAVNCDRQQEYINQIRHMEESVQLCIMLAIKQLEDVTGEPGRSRFNSFENDARLQRLTTELEAMTETKEALAQQCHNLETQVSSLQEERLTLMSEYKNLVKQFKEQETSLDINRSPENRRQIDQLNEEIFKLETMRDDDKAKVLDLERQLSAMQEKVLELQQAAEVNSRLKDDLDAMSESAAKVQALEVQVASYKKKLEDYNDTKRQLKQLEEKNVQYIQETMQYEEELKKHNVWKNQTELYKAESAQLQQKLDEEIQLVDELSFRKTNAEAKLEVVQKEKERLVQERDLLREENEELRAISGKMKDRDVEAMAQELTPTEMKERLRFLETENGTLRTSKQELDATRNLLDDKSTRLEKLTDQNRAINQRVLALEAQLEELQVAAQPQVAANPKSAATIASLQESLAAKEQELHDMQAKYSRCLEKVVEVDRTLDAAASTSKSNGAASANSIESLRASANVMKEMESRLMTTAFHNLSLKCHREAVDERLAMLSTGQSFLSRQRQPVPRKQASIGATSTPYRSK